MGCFDRMLRRDQTASNTLKRRTNLWVILVSFTSLLLWGCSSKEETAPSAPPVQTDRTDTGETATAKLSKTERELLAIDKLAEAGKVDKAAAALVKMRMKGTQFSADEAAAYRDSLSLVYDRTLELEEEGDARAKNALKILQSNGAF